MNRLDKKQNDYGFTLIELMFSMVFISLLIILITMTIMQILNIYNRGMLMHEVNQTGRTITDQMQRTIASSTPSENVQIVENYKLDGTGESTGGRFCLGNYSYIWNYGKTLQDSIITENIYKEGTSASGNAIKFIKVPDVGGYYCMKDEDTELYPAIDGSEAIEMLSNDRHGLVLYDMVINSGSNAYDSISNQRLYYVEAVVGTSDYKTIDVTTGGRSCKPPSDSESDQSFCSINSFSFVGRAGNI